MKIKHLMMAVMLLFVTSVTWGQSLRGIRKVVDKQRRELKLQHRIVPNAAQRIQPAAAEYYTGNEASPSAYYKYDAWGNETEFFELSGEEIRCAVQTWDNSHGYPVLLDEYSCDKLPDGTMGNFNYYQQTTLDANGIRTAIKSKRYDQVTLDAVGHVLSTQQDNESYTKKNEYTWDGELLSSFKYECNDYYYGEQERFDMTDIHIVYQDKPFNAYELDYYGILFLPEDPQDGSCWINAGGTYSCQNEDESISGILQIATEVSADKKDLVMTTTIDGKLMKKATLIYADENSSYTSRFEYANGEYEQEICTYNEYGDLINRVSEDNVSRSEFRYEWEYDNGKPLQVKEYCKSDGDAEESLEFKFVFTAWHNGSSISTIATSPATILGATLYTLDGVKVRTLTAEEAQNAEAITAPQSGIYLLVVRTDRGVETRKVAISH